MEITLLEDPACCWCWAFQPVVTALEFEVLGGGSKRAVQLRRVMGGLSDRPAVEGSFSARTWTRASEISGMPFNAEIWENHLLATTYEACRAVKAACAQGLPAAARLLRRMREAFFVQGIPIDSRQNILDLARDASLNVETLGENLANGRGAFLFERDRHEAAPYRFGFPTVLVRKHLTDAPVVLHGLVSYQEILQALARMGFASDDRKRFVDRPEDWERLFSIHCRLALAELRQVTGLEGDVLLEACARNGLQRDGPFFTRLDSSAPAVVPPLHLSAPGEVAVNVG